MKQHFCPVEQSVITYQDKCNWCGEKETLTQTQEPVALACCNYADASAVKWNPHNQVVQCHNCGQTYTPPQRSESSGKPSSWVGLTDDEIIDVIHPLVMADMPDEATDYEIAKAIEAKLKEKNT